MPEIAQSFVVPFPGEQVWRFLTSPALVATCMPGASLTEPPDGNRLVGQMRVKLGPIAAAFAGEAELTLDDATWIGSIRGQGLDKKNNSRAKSDVIFAVRDQPGGTLVDIKVDYTLTGILAQFSRGAIVQEIARRLTSEFAHNIEAKMDAEAFTPTPAAAGGALLPAADASLLPGRELNIGALLWSIIVGWVRRIFGPRQ